MDDEMLYKKSSTEVLNLLGSTIDGLNDKEVAKRQQKYGLNILKQKKNYSIFHMFFKNFKDPIIIILLISCVFSLIINEKIDALIILLIILLDITLGTIEEYKTNKSVNALKKLIKVDSKVIRNAKEVLIDSSNLTIGDIVVLESGNKIAADARIIESSNLTVDESSLTGESVPTEKNASLVFSNPVGIGDRLNLAYMSTTVSYGRGLGVVVNTGMETEIGKIATSIDMEEENETPLQKVLAKLSKYLGLLTLLIVILVLVVDFIWIFIDGKNLEIEAYIEAILSSISLAVAAIPEGLAVVVTIVLAIGVQRMAKANTIVRKLHSVETLGAVSVICSDKTGTLTQGEFRVARIKAVGMTEEELLKLVAHVESYSNHPLAKSLADAYGKELDTDSVRSVKEKPGFGISATYEGQRVHVGSRRMMDAKKLLVDEINEPGTVVYVCVGREYAGYVLVQDQVKEEAKATLTWLKEKYRAFLVMLTGDTEKTGRAVGRELHMDYVYTDLLPQDKLEQLEDFMSIQGEAEKLVCVGDGINDAPVLSRADIGIAMGAMGSDAAIEAADVVLMDDDPMKIATAIKISRKCLKIVYQNISVAIGVKLICLILGAVGIANMWLAIFADVGVMILAVLNAIRALFVKKM